MTAQLRADLEGHWAFRKQDTANAPGKREQSTSPERHPESTSVGVTQDGLSLVVTPFSRSDHDTVALEIGGKSVAALLTPLSGTSSFAVELPPWVWDHADESGEALVSLVANETAIGTTIIKASEAADALQALRFRPNSDIDEILLGLEHACFLARQITFSGPVLTFLWETGRRFGCIDYMADYFSVATDNVALYSNDPSDQNVRFTAAYEVIHQRLLHGHVITSSLLNETAQQFGLDDSQELDLLEAFVANICRLGQFENIVELPSDGWIKKLAESGDANKVTIALPFLVARGKPDEAAAALRGLASLPGWVNTECIFEASVHRSGVAQGLDDGIPYLYALISYLDAVRGQYWSRLYDRNLARSLLPWIERMHLMPDWLRRDLVDATLRTVSLSCDFWDLWSEPQRQCPQAVRLTKARHAFTALSRQIRSLGSSNEVLQALDAARLFRSFENLDASAVIRELVFHISANYSEDAGLIQEARKEIELLGELEPLRILSHPSNRLPRDIHHRDEIADLIRNASDGHYEQTASPHAATQEFNGRRIARFDPDQAGDHATLDALASDAMWLNNAGAGWLATDVLLQFADRLPSSSQARAFFLTKAKEALSSALDSGANVADFPALQVAAQKLEEAELPNMAAKPDLQALHTGRSGPAIDGKRHERIPGHSDTLVVIYSCRKNLDDRIPLLRETWISELKARGIPYVVLVGDGDDTLHDDVLRLDVADTYEALPAKTLKLVEWTYSNTDFQYLVKVDDDCYFAVERFFEALSYRKFHYYGRVIHRGEGDTSRTWHHTKSSSDIFRHRLDRSPEPSRYCDGSTGYSLSRHAMGLITQSANSDAGRRLISMSYFEDKLLGDLLAFHSIEPRNEDYFTHVLRKTEGAENPVAMYQNSYYPSRVSPINMVHLDEAKTLQTFHDHNATDVLSPQKIWPTHSKVCLGYNTQQLEFISNPERLNRLRSASIVVVAVVRNEMVLLRHFLDHYRALGVEAFLMADNLSCDGSREYLLKQEDVTLYSVDSEYRDSHYGVDWQQAMLGNHCLGKWVVLVDIDEFLTYPGVQEKSLIDVTSELDGQGYDAARAMLVDMYPESPLSECEFKDGRPFELATYHDNPPVLQVCGSGKFTNSTDQFTSSLRHRLMPHSQVSLFMAVKVPLIRYSPLLRLSEGIHFVGNLSISSEDLTLAHFKYHADFANKVETEIQRAQHFDGAVEYKQYHAMLAQTNGTLFKPGTSQMLSADLRPSARPTHTKSSTERRTHGH